MFFENLRAKKDRLSQIGRLLKVFAFIEHFEVLEKPTKLENEQIGSILRFSFGFCVFEVLKRR